METTVEGSEGQSPSAAEPLLAFVSSIEATNLPAF